MRMRSGLAFFALSTCLATTAFAQDAPPAAPAAPTAPPPVVQAPAVAPAAPDAEPGDKDGVRFRGGISGGAGFFAGNISGGLGGVDGRLGVQINHYLGVYGQPHLVFGGGSTGAGFGGALGVFAFTGLVDLTLAHRIFVGAGGGGGIFNNPGGGVLHFRAGGYPLQGFGNNGFTRKGLMVGADLRVFFLSGLTLVETIFSVGYEVF